MKVSKCNLAPVPISKYLSWEQIKTYKEGIFKIIDKSPFIGYGHAASIERPEHKFIIILTNTLNKKSILFFDEEHGKLETACEYAWGIVGSNITFVKVDKTVCFELKDR